MPDGFDLSGAARDLDERAKRFGPIFSQPAMVSVTRMLYRNPWTAPALLEALEAELSAHPEKAVPLNAPLFTPDGKLAIELREVAG